MSPLTSKWSGVAVPTLLSLSLGSLGAQTPTVEVIRDLNAITESNEPESSHPKEFKSVRNRVYFTGDEGTRLLGSHGRELWFWDSGYVPRVRVVDINEGPESSNPHDLTVVDEVLFFLAKDNLGIERLWRVHQDTLRSIALTDVQTIWKLAEYDGKLHFLGRRTTGGALGVWSLATTPGTSTPVLEADTGDSKVTAPDELTNVGGFLAFSAMGDGATKRSLWRFKGGNVAEVDLGSDDTPTQLTSNNGKLLFAASSGSKVMISSDGTAASEITLSGSPIVSATEFTNVAGSVYVRSGDAENQLFKIDVSSESASQITVTGDPMIYDLVNWNEILYFLAQKGTGLELLRVSGSKAISQFSTSDVSNAQDLTATDSYLAFSAETSGTDREIWTYDGTSLVEHELRAPGSADPDHLYAFGNSVFFAGYSTNVGVEPHRLFQE